MLASPKPGFNGSIRWSFSERTCEWSSPERGSIDCTSFDAPTASDDGENDCSTSFEEWMLAEECCDRQYEGAIKEVVDQLCLAALQEWATQWDFPCVMTETEILLVKRSVPLKEPEKGISSKLESRGPYAESAHHRIIGSSDWISYWLVKIRLN